MGLRQRNRLAAMRLVQITAVELFEQQGFEATTIETVADVSGVSTSTIYRHFGNKESLILWDERDDVVDAELAVRLGQQPPLDAFRDAVIAAFDQREDPELFLRRLKLIYAEPAILGVAAQSEAQARVELANAFAATSRRRPGIADEVAAAIALGAFDVALHHWQRSDGKGRLAAAITKAFDAARER